MGEDDDLYNDLPEGTTSDYIAEIENKLKSYQEKSDDSQKQIKQLENEKRRHQIRINDLEKNVENLEKNISSLYKTAVAELRRKDKMLNELQMEADSVAFRRFKNFPDRSTSCHRAKVREHRDVYEKHRNGDVNPSHEKYAHTLSDRQRNYYKRNHEDINPSSKKYPHISSDRPRNCWKRNYHRNSDNTSNKPLYGKPAENLIEKKRNSCERNDHRRNDHVSSNSDKTSNKTIPEKPTENLREEILDQKSCDRNDHHRNDHVSSNPDKTSNKTIPEKPTENLREEILGQKSCDGNDHRRNDHVSSNSDETSNKTIPEKPTENVLEEILGQKNCPFPCEAALLSMKKQSWKLITPLKETPNYLKEKFSQIESNKSTVKIPMINEQRMLSPFKNVGRVEIVSRYVDEVEPPKATNSEIAAACSVTISEDIEHGVFFRKNRKRPRIQNITIDVKKVSVSC